MGKKNRGLPNLFSSFHPEKPESGLVPDARCAVALLQAARQGHKPQYALFPLPPWRKITGAQSPSRFFIPGGAGKDGLPFIQEFPGTCPPDAVCASSPGGVRPITWR